MRRFIIGAASLALVLVLGAPSASAQFAVGGGITVPSGDYGDYAKTGWMAEAAFSPFQNADGTFMFWIEGIFGQNKHEGDGDDKTTLFGGFGTATYALTQGASANPYVIGSVGYLNHKYQPATGDSESSGGLGFGGGAGLSFGDFWVEGRYMTASIDDATTAFLMFLAGVSF